jgi:hypothetical protein
MKSKIWIGLFFAGVACMSAARAQAVCTQLPTSLQNTSVSYINQSSELQKLDGQLDAHLQSCMGPVTPDNRKAICANGKLVAEQVLRVIARIDEAGRKNAFLSNAKMKSYKSGEALQGQMKKLAADKTC